MGLPRGCSPQTLHLVSCVGAKLDHPAPARDLYVSAWFRFARRYVELRGGPWLILSAEHGVLRPDVIVAPYEKTLLNMPIDERRRWADRVSRQLRRLAPDRLPSVVVLAGARYREFLMHELRARSKQVLVPLEGQGIGQQLRSLKLATQR